ncbi:MAG: hypothetical protein LBK07_00270 [Tannerella sp.]|jgi:hypothetical protein|nr:hypothetical protein [Tannerella sp.]
MSYMPQNIEKLIGWATTFVAGVETHAVAWGLSPQWVADVRGRFGELKAAYEVWEDPATRTIVSHAALTEARKAFKGTVEPLVRNLKSLPGLTVYDYDLLQIPARHSGGYSPVLAPPKTWPVLNIKVFGQGAVAFHYRDSEASTSAARPRGARAAVVRTAFIRSSSPAVEELNGLTFTMTRSPAWHAFPPECIGDTLHAVAAWISPTGKMGPWGPVVKVTVA